MPRCVAPGWSVARKARAASSTGTSEMPVFSIEKTPDAKLAVRGNAVERLGKSGIGPFTHRL